MYDSVIAVGLGFCAAEKRRRQPTTRLLANSTNLEVVEAIQQLSFTGASGHVMFDLEGPYPGQRVGHSVSFAAYNIKLPTADDLEVIQVTDILRGTDRPIYRQWQSVRPFIHADGTTAGPQLLRAVPDHNYLTIGSRSWGLTLFALSMLVNLSANVWIYAMRNHRVLKAGQPEFLAMVSMGSTLFAASIIPNSFDESYGWDADQLSRACNVAPWLIVIGFMLIYSGLWLKLWRVNKVLQFARAIKVTVRSVIGPALIFFGVIIAALSTWSVIEGFEWRRVEIDELTGESAGGCAGENTAYWFTPIVVLMMIPIGLTARMAWLTRDIDSKYSESHWIVIMIVSQVQLLLISIPLLLLVDGMMPNVRYVGQSSVFAVFSLTTITLIFGPKIYEVYFAKAAASNSRSNDPYEGGYRPRGSTAVGGNVYVSGLSMSLGNTTVSRYSTTRQSLSSRGGGSNGHGTVGPDGEELTDTNWNEYDDDVLRTPHQQRASIKMTAGCETSPRTPIQSNNGDRKAIVPATPQDLGSVDEVLDETETEHEAPENGCVDHNDGKAIVQLKSIDIGVGDDEVDDDDDDSHMSSGADPPPPTSRKFGSSAAMTVKHSNVVKGDSLVSP